MAPVLPGSGRIPVTLLSGYLGAGKTTAVNRLLAAGAGRRLAVLVNDFGAVSVDAALIEARDATTISLANGCLCCAVSDDLGGALDGLAALPGPPEQVLIEASGVAHPARIARMAGGWPGFALDAVATVADPETLRARAADKFVGRLVRDQVEAADLLLLSRADLAGPAAVADARALLAGLAPGRPVLDAAEAAAAPDLLLGPLVSGAQPRPLPGPAPHPAFSSRIWTPPGPIAPERMREILAALPAPIHRAKGFFVTPDGAMMLAQRAGARVEIAPAAPAGPAIVLIAAGPAETRENALARAIAELDAAPFPKARSGDAA